MLNDFLTENVYPSTDLANRNLDFMIRDLQKMMIELKTFVSINSVKYADPIRWDITRQYEKNTIVIDPLTGTAYISVTAVPIGVALTRTEYWTPVFDLEQFVTKGAKNFTSRFEEQTTLTATFPTPVNGWLVWNSTLYRALTNIVAGDQYTPDSNIKEFTMEDVIGHPEDVTLYEDGATVCNLIEGLYNLTTESLTELFNFIGDLSNLTTEDKTSLVDAINELVTDINNINTDIGDLADLTTTDKTSIVNAINEVDANADAIDTKVGDLNDLATTDKTSIVNAINDINSIIPPGVDYITPQMHGAAGDGVEDDTTAINNAITECLTSGQTLYFPAGIYYISSPISITNCNFDIIMDGKLLSDGDGIKISACFGHAFKLKVDQKLTTNGSVGIELNDFKNCTMTCDSRNYDIALYCNSTTTGVAYNTFNDCILFAKSKSLLLMANTPTGWVNENVFNNIRCVTAADSGEGVTITSNRGYYNNNNIFNKPCVEGAHNGFLLEYAADNAIYNARMETLTGWGITAKNNSIRNNFIDPYVSGSFILVDNACSCDGVDMTFTRFSNMYKLADSKEIKNVAANNATEMVLPPHWFSLGANNVKVATNNGALVGNGLALQGSPTVQYFIHVKPQYMSYNPKPVKFMVSAHGYSQFNIVVIPYDSNNNVITGLTLSANNEALTYVNNGTNEWYISDALNDGQYIINLPFNVDHVYIGVIAFSIYDFTIFGETSRNYDVVCDTAEGLTSIPTDAGRKGQYVHNIGSDTTLAGWYYDGSTWQADYINSAPPTP